MPRALRTILAAALLFGATAATAVAVAKRPKPQPCPGGRFVVLQNQQLIVGGAVTPETDAVTVQGVEVAIGSGCPLLPGKVKATKKGTKVTDKWPVCGSLQKVRLKALIEPDCNTMTGTLTAKKTKRSLFEAKRSFCGDGIIDRGGGEACDGGVGCPNSEVCTEMCTCAGGLGSTTTLPRSSTSTTSTSTTTTTLCPAGQMFCAGMCVDTSTDPNNCGACNFHCPMTGAVCTAGACRCPAEDTLCGSRCNLRPCYCANLHTDSGNCGTCGFVCNGAPGEVCQGGVCSCPGGGTVCNGLCVDTQTDNNNCGGCGNVCSTLPVCIGGVCTIP